MITVLEPAYAKVNLTLDVLCKRPDGYHDLKSVMQTVSLQDDVSLTLGTLKPWSLKCDKEGIPCDERNLAWKAARVFFDAVGTDPNGLEMRIDKRIPSQAGLGGGSSDAAAVLRALNRHYGQPLSLTALAELGAQVGSDVPFCVLGGTVMCEGRGERMRPLPGLPECYFVIVKPDFPISTPALYRKIDDSPILSRPDHEGMERALARGELNEVCLRLCNVFDPVVSQDHGELDEIKAVFAQCGALGWQMSGSGSAVYCITDKLAVAERICHLLDSFGQTFIAKPV